MPAGLDKMCFNSSIRLPLAFALGIFIPRIHHRVQGQICTCTTIGENENIGISPLSGGPIELTN